MILEKSFQWHSPLDQETLNDLFRQEVVSICINNQRELTSSIYRQDYQSMLPRKWLRTGILDLALMILLEKQSQQIMKLFASKGLFQENQHRDFVKLVNAFVVTLIMTNQQDFILKSLQPLDLFSTKTKYLLLPINTQNVQGSHWVLGLFINGAFEDKKQLSQLWIFDSAHSGPQIGIFFRQKLQNLYKVFYQKQIEIQLIIAEDIPHQKNDYDCGIYAISFCEYVLKEIVSSLEDNDQIKLNRLNSQYKHLSYNSSSREKYRRLIQRNMLETHSK